jgi:hypothetical protein
VPPISQGMGSQTIFKLTEPLTVETVHRGEVTAAPEDPVGFDGVGLMLDLRSTGERLLLPWGEVVCIRQGRSRDQE